jgi:predicted NAD/FAD-dependent oxidoreductase
VVVLDKGRSQGGRLATRRIGDATFDHGAQFFTARTERFAAAVAEWTEAGVVREWCRGFVEPADGYPRYAVAGGMNALAKHLARGIAVRTGSLAFSLRRAGAGPGSTAPWHVVLDSAEVLAADAVVVATPVPQAVALTITAEVELPHALRGIDYDRTLALSAVLDRPPAIPSPGAVQHGDPTFSMIVDNMAKGVSAVPAVTAHASANVSLARWDDDRDATASVLLDALAPWLRGARVVEHQVKRWRLATPQTTWHESCWSATDGPGALALAGDAFTGPAVAGPKIEAAVVSGWAAAAAVLDRS